MWRVHVGKRPFSAENAWSRPWGEDGESVRGYSATTSPSNLVRYFQIHGGGLSDEAPIVAFEGAIVGVGPDNEPLAIPKRVIAWIRGRDLDDGILENEDDPVMLAYALTRLGSKRKRA